MRVFWNYTKAFMGLPLLLPITKDAIKVPAILITTMIASQYLLTSSVYYDQYDGEAYESARRR